jgi:serine/threonine protein kinase
MGAILYEMLTGRPPFRAESPLDMLRQVVEEPPKHPSTINRAVDRDLASVCLKCLEKNPAHRYGSAQALVEDLEHWLKGEPVEARSVHNLRRLWSWCRREPMVAGLVSGMFLLVAAIAILAVVLYQVEKNVQDALQQDKDLRLRMFLDRIEEEWHQADQGKVTIPAADLALVSNYPLSVDGTENHVVLGFTSNLRKLDEAVHLVAPLARFLQTNFPSVGAPMTLFDLQIYTSRSNAIADLLEGKIGLMRADPADYIMVRQQVTNIFPLVKQVHAGRPDLHGSIFTMEAPCRNASAG